MNEIENLPDNGENDTVYDERWHLEQTIKQYSETVDECKDGAKFLISLYELVNK